jgi:hypothetical protein
MFTRISDRPDCCSRKDAKTQRRRAHEARGVVPKSGGADERSGRHGLSLPSLRLRASARTLAFLSPLLLAACGSNGTPQGASNSGKIECAPQGATEFKRECPLDRIAGDDGLTLVVHNPDGGFHRLRVTTDGRGVVAADGAERATVTITGPGVIEVAVGGDRYRLPATIKGQAPS